MTAHTQESSRPARYDTNITRVLGDPARRRLPRAPKGIRGGIAKSTRRRAPTHREDMNVQMLTASPKPCGTARDRARQEAPTAHAISVVLDGPGLS